MGQIKMFAPAPETPEAAQQMIAAKVSEVAAEVVRLNYQGVFTSLHISRDSIDLYTINPSRLSCLCPHGLLDHEMLEELDQWLERLDQLHPENNEGAEHG